MFKKNILLIVGIFVFASLTFGTTYSYLTRTLSSNTENMATSGYINLVAVSNSGNISLSNMLPMTVSEGEASTGYTFTITNNGNIPYTVDIKLLATTLSNSIDTQYIYVKVDSGTSTLLSNYSNSIIKSNVTLAAGGSTTITIRMWLSINTPNSQIGKTFAGNLVVVSH